MHLRRLLFLAIGASLIAMACSAAGTPAPTGGSSPTPSPTASLLGGGQNSAAPTSSATAAPSSSPGASVIVSPKPSLGVIDPCQLLTAGDASTLIGVTVTHSQGGGAGATGPCVYADAGHDSVAVRARVATDAPSATALFTAAKTGLSSQPGLSVKTVTGIGDAAFEGIGSASGLKAESIYVLSGSTFFYVSTLSETLTPSDAALQAAASIALQKL